MVRLLRAPPRLRARGGGATDPAGKNKQEGSGWRSCAPLALVGGMTSCAPLGLVRGMTMRMGSSGPPGTAWVGACTMRIGSRGPPGAAWDITVRRIILPTHSATEPSCRGLPRRLGSTRKGVANECRRGDEAVEIRRESPRRARALIAVVAALLFSRHGIAALSMLMCSRFARHATGGASGYAAA